MSVTELSAAAGTSERTLRRAFAERCGVSPQQYILRWRLHGVRRELRHGRPCQAVCSSAQEWGFWHMGDFAAHYR